MADLENLFKESGLQGILPYSFGMGGAGYQFLCQKMREGVPFWVITSNDNQMPFIFTKENKVYFALYSALEMAEERCGRLEMDQYDTLAVSIDPSDWAAALWKRYRDLGATHVCFDDSVWIDMRDLAPVATYEGVLSSGTPLRNPSLHAALYCAAQDMAAGRCSDALSAYFWDMFKRSSFYFPLRPTRQLRPGESLNEYNSEYHFAALEDGSPVILGFTDGEFLRIYAAANQLEKEEISAVIISEYPDMKRYLDEHPGLSLLLNSGAGNFLFSQDTIGALEVLSLNQSAANAGHYCQNA